MKTYSTPLALPVRSAFGPLARRGSRTSMHSAVRVTQVADSNLTRHAVVDRRSAPRSPRRRATAAPRVAASAAATPGPRGRRTAGVAPPMMRVSTAWHRPPTAADRRAAAGGAGAPRAPASRLAAPARRAPGGAERGGAGSGTARRERIPLDHERVLGVLAPTRASRAAAGSPSASRPGSGTCARRGSAMGRSPSVRRRAGPGSRRSGST